jgi:hypothetical protein
MFELASGWAVRSPSARGKPDRGAGSSDCKSAGRIEKTFALGEAREAYREVAAGAAGRIVLRPQE